MLSKRNFETYFLSEISRTTSGTGRNKTYQESAKGNWGPGCG